MEGLLAQGCFVCERLKSCIREAIRNQLRLQPLRGALSSRGHGIAGCAGLHKGRDIRERYLAIFRLEDKARRLFLHHSFILTAAKEEQADHENRNKMSRDRAHIEVLAS